MKVGTYKRLVAAAESVITKFESEDVEKYRVVTSLWKYILLHNMDNIRIRSQPARLVGKNIGAGVWEISME